MTEELWDQVRLSHHVLLAAGDTAAGDPVAEEWVRTCNGVGNAEGPGRTVSTMFACSWQQEVGRVPVLRARHQMSFLSSRAIPKESQNHRTV